MKTYRSKLFIVKIEYLQITLRRQNLKAFRNYKDTALFSIINDEFPPLLSVSQNFSRPVCPVRIYKPLPPVNPSKHVCSFNFNKSMASSIKYVRKIFRKSNISNPRIRTRMCAYLGVRNVDFSEIFAYVLNGWPL